ncbi:hypothetical protein J8I87_36450 [Paraburkholderia sp. LEh10]|jgi:hypothetical protein|uniref:hypothetical protein n=1 Tax=Paraburkholderia sp. LEh10 TaxID=2821353 RepID=UPI001AE656A5|nr:hypothetical protein [Paraburkholderia sp. LEh10]MBP0595054.1 hypothetical protein [Paraburkholderia sp. LEh10]
MKVILAAWRALCLVGNVSMYVAAFFLWSAIAAGAGWMLVHLPDVWYVVENESSTSFAVAAIMSYAIGFGVLFLGFACGVLQMLADAYKEILLFARKRRSRRAVSAIQRRQPLFIRKVRLGPSCATSQARGTRESIPPPATAGVPERQRTAQAEAASASARKDSPPT